MGIGRARVQVTSFGAEPRDVGIGVCPRAAAVDHSCAVTAVV
jgi:hypothetical protein